MAKLIGFCSMAVIVYSGLRWLGESVICELLTSVGMAGQTGTVTGLVAFGAMGLLLIVVCFKS